MKGLWQAIGLAVLAGTAYGQPATPPPGRPYLFVLDVQGTPLGEFPSTVQALNGVMTVVDQNGQHMLKASSPSEFLITLPQVLPSDFTVVLDFIPKGCCAPDDIMLEGTSTMNRGSASAQLTWHPERISVVGGSPDMYQSAMPADLAASTPGNLTQVVVEFSGTTIKLYTNGRRLYTLDKQFARGHVLRVWLGGADDGLNAVYLAGLRIAAGTGLGLIAAATTAGGALTALTGPSNPVVGTAGSGTVATQQSAAMATGSLAGAPTSLALSPPVGAGAAWAPPAAQAAGTAMTMSINQVPFPVVLLSGGSLAATVLETRLADGSVKKQVRGATLEPLNFEVGLGSPVQGWLKSELKGAATFNDGAVYGGFVPPQQELDFSRAALNTVTVPLLDVSSAAAAQLRVTITPQSVTQGVQRTSVLSISTARARAIPWSSADFRFTMGSLETRRTTRIEPFTITQAPGQPAISNLLVTFSVDAAHPATNWLAWYDDFVVKGNNGDSNEKTFALELGLGLNVAGPARMTLTGYGVGIVALRALPVPAGSSFQLLQAELYVERMEVLP
jgi:hypothetical protein